MRLFTGIALPEAILTKVGECIDQLRPVAPLRWSKVHNLHVTTKFIGEWPEARLDEVRERLAAIPTTGRVPIALRGFGFFSRILYAGIEVSPALVELASRTSKAMAEIGIEEEQRKYSPHLTLARFEPGTDVRPIKRRLASVDSNFGEFEAYNFALYLSRNGEYSVLAEYPL